MTQPKPRRIPVQFENLSVRVGDARLYIRDSDQSRPSFSDDSIKIDIMLPLAKYLRQQHGWTTSIPYEDRGAHSASRGDLKAARRFAEQFRTGFKDGLEFEMQCNPHSMEIQFWENVADHTADNSHGGKYIFDKEEKMPRRQLLRLHAVRLQIIDWLIREGMPAENADFRPFAPAETAHQRVTRSYEESWHKDHSDYQNYVLNQYDSTSNAKDANGLLLTQGCAVFGRDYNGRPLQGRAYHNINNMWWVIAGSSLFNIASFYLHQTPPADAFDRVSKEDRVKRLKATIATAVEAEDYLKAHKFKCLLESQQAAN